jgi:hypothetical protein
MRQDGTEKKFICVPNWLFLAVCLGKGSEGLLYLATPIDSLPPFEMDFQAPDIYETLIQTQEEHGI